MEEYEIQSKIEERKGAREYSNIIVAMWRWGLLNGDDKAVECDTLQDVVNFIGKSFRDDAVDEPNVKIHVQGKPEELTDKYVSFKSSVYTTDERNGVCADGDPLSIRYKRIDNGRVFKMRCGKFFRRLIDEMRPDLPESGRVYFSEQLAAMYRAGHAQDGRYTLTLDRDFERIYSECGEFGSCMHGKKNWQFYVDSCPDALAAGLWEGDQLLARCIVYNNVRDTTNGETYRLAERQYGKNSETRRQLIYLLIEQGKIDGYKQFDVSCWDNRKYVLNDGTSLESHELESPCTAKQGDYMSFQDGFRFLDMDEEVARNWDDGDSDADLAHTDLYIYRPEPEDGDEDGDMRYVAHDGEWYRYDNVVYCTDINEYRHTDDAVYCEHEDEYISLDNATTLWNDEHCHDDDAVLIEAGEHRDQYMHRDDDERVTCIDGRTALQDDCVELESKFYGYDKFVPADEGGVVETEAYDRYGSFILEKDAVYLDECTGDDEARHKDDKDIVRAFIFDTDGMRCGWVEKADAVEIRGTWYYMYH